MSEQIQMLVQVAIMYYSDGCTQQEIARKLGISRQTISKLLTCAREQGIVEIKINNPLRDVEELSAELIARFSLKDAVVLPYSSSNEDLVKSVLAQRAAVYVRDIIISGGIKKIALGWGRTMYSFISAFEAIETDNAVVYPLTGATDNTVPFYMTNEMVRSFAEKTSATAAYAYIPANPSDSHDAELFRRTSSYRSINALWKAIDLAVIGIGKNPSAENWARARYPGELTENMPEGIAGDLCTNYFDMNGRFSNFNSDMLRASPENLKSADRVVAIAGGGSKAAAILGALRTQALTDIIIDIDTCKKTLRS